MASERFGKVLDKLRWECLLNRAFITLDFGHFELAGG